MHPHEPEQRGADTPLPSERAFGLLIAAVLAALAFWPLLRGGSARPWLLLGALPFAALALLRPGWLRPALRAWMALGALLSRVVNPIVLGVMFYGLITPLALLMRAAGRDPLRLRRDADAASYWQPRAPDPAPDLREQF